MKRILKRILNNFGLEVRRKPKHGKVLNYDDIYKKKINIDNPIIFDVGANKGQSVERFKNIFKKPKIFGFEPNPDEYNFALNKFKNDNDIILNNIALADNETTLPFNVTINTGNSSFYDFNKETDWIKIRSKEFNTSPDKFITKKIDVKCSTLDNFCLINKINHINILKIDTQGYEDKILDGATKIIDKKMVDFIEMEIMLDEVYSKTLSFYEIEKRIKNNYKLYGIDYQGFKNLSEGYMFAIDALYVKK